MKSEKKEAKGSTGFTLLELLLVVVIIGILAAVVTPRLVGKSKEAKISAAKSQINSLSLAIDMFELNIGAFPQALEDLIADPGMENWKGPYLRKTAVPQDPWHKDYVYACPSSHGPDYDLSSDGPDGQNETEDDICSWKL